MDLLSNENPKDFFKQWNFSALFLSEKKTSVRKKFIYINVIASKQDSYALRTHVQCSSNMKRSYKVKNKRRNKNLQSKKMIIFRIPPLRNYSAKDIKIVCKKKRGWASKCQKVLQIALARGLEYNISRELIDEDSIYYNKNIVQILEKYNTPIHEKESSIFLD